MFSLKLKCNHFVIQMNLYTPHIFMPTFPTGLRGQPVDSNDTKTIGITK